MDLDKLKEALAAATPGPWVSFDKKFCFAVQLGKHKAASVQINHGSDAANIPFYGNREQARANAALIAMAPDLAADVIRLTAERDAAVAASQALMVRNDALLAFAEEVRDYKPEVISGRRRNPQDDVPDMMDVEVFYSFQSDAAILAGKAGA